MAGKQAERFDQSAAAQKPERSDSNLGVLLTAARERHRLTQSEAAQKASIPAHYVRMLEANDYGLISDQLYLLPFLRKYAGFLDLDADVLGMRFVNEVQ